MLSKCTRMPLALLALLALLPAASPPAAAERDAPAPVEKDQGRPAHPTFDPASAGPYVDVEDAIDEAKIAASDPSTVRLGNGRVLHPQPGLDTPQGEPLAGIYMLQFPGRVRGEWRAAIDALGVRVHDYLDADTLVVEIPPSAGEGVRGLLNKGLVRHLSHLPPEARVDRALLAPWDGGREVGVVLFHQPDEAEWVSLRTWIAVDQFDTEPLPVVRGVVTAEGAGALAALDLVRWIEPYAPGRLQNIESTMSGGADIVVGTGKATGAGVRVAVDDTGIARTGDSTQCIVDGSYHPDLAAWRIADEYDFHDDDANACDRNGHGTHTAGTIGGDGTYINDWTGVAPDVTFLAYRDCCYSDQTGFDHFTSVLGRAAAHDADIVANSWGGYNGVYNQSSFDADTAVRGGYIGSNGLPRRLFVSVSAGNDNALTLAPGTGKNVVTVGALKDGNAPSDYNLCAATQVCGPQNCGCAQNPTCSDTDVPPWNRVCFSNLGPIDTDGDGHTRIKPDIVAPGVNILSTVPSYMYVDNRYYDVKSGTSMAQPNIAGTAALMLETYPSLKGWPEMIKARLLATAVSLGDTAQYGHGLVDAYHAVQDSPTVTTALWNGGAAPATGVDLDKTFTVPAGFVEVRVYLTWSDPPSLTTEVVDDLDLRVLDGSGGLVASSASFDDNVEWVRVTGGTPGTWHATIRGYDVPDPSARYGIIAVVITGSGGVGMSAYADPACLHAGDWTQIHSSLSSGGPIEAGTRTLLDMPDDPSLFTLSGVWLNTADPARAHFYAASDLPYSTAANISTLYQGSVVPGAPRTAIWNLHAMPGTPEGTYPFSVQGASAVPPAASTLFVPVTIDATPPGGVGSLASTDHGAGTCTNNLSVAMSWTPAPDGTGCGVAGYSVLWSAGAPESPDSSKDIGAVTTYTSSPGASATPLYFNIRSVDGAGNWQTSYQTWGAIRLDATPPGDAARLYSPTNPPGSCQAPGTVTMNWYPASDDNCGVAGYSVLWSLDGTALPDMVMDIGAASTWSTTLYPSHSQRWFNIRTVDVAGNWAAGAPSYGPITVDTVPGEVPDFMLRPAGGDLFFMWGADPDADAYRVYRDTSPQFSAPAQVGTDTTDLSLLQSGGMVSEPIVYYRVVGTNICGLEGP